MDKLNSAERLHVIIGKLTTTPYQFAKNIGVARAHVVYDVLNNKSEISRVLANRIIETYPNIRLEWLLTGIGEMLAWTDKSLKYGEISVEKGGSGKATCEACKERDMIIEECKKIISQQRQLIDSLTNLQNTKK